MMFGPNFMNDYIDKIVMLAQEVEVGDPIDWGVLNIDEESAYQLIAMSVIENIHSQENIKDKDVMIATIVKLVVENFTLNLKLNQREKDGN
jgi:hypothetical protein